MTAVTHRPLLHRSVGPDGLRFRLRCSCGYRAVFEGAGAATHAYYQHLHSGAPVRWGSPPPARGAVAVSARSVPDRRPADGTTSTGRSPDHVPSDQGPMPPVDRGHADSPSATAAPEGIGNDAATTSITKTPPRGLAAAGGLTENPKEVSMDHSIARTGGVR